MLPTSDPVQSLPLGRSADPRNRARVRRAPIAAALVAVAAVVAAASPAQSPPPEPAATPAGETHAEAAAPPAPLLLPGGALVFVDPSTGRILERPRPEQLAALRALRLEQAASARDPEERRRLLDALPRFAVPGGFGVDIDGLFPTALIVERGPDGRLRVRCSDPDPHGDHGASVPPAPAIAPPEL
jgi:hypothetical protein